MIFDRTCTGPGIRLGLSDAWRVGGLLYDALDRVDARFGVASWTEALDWLANVEPSRRIGEIQFWGHGLWGRGLVSRESLDIDAFRPGNPYNARLAAVRNRLVTGGRALWWWRTCETLGTAVGHEFARAQTRFLDCRVAGHTYIIGFWQSGLHCLAPGFEPNWPVDEGRDRTAPFGQPRAMRSTASAPNTITCLRGSLPDGVDS